MSNLLIDVNVISPVSVAAVSAAMHESTNYFIQYQLETIKYKVMICKCIYLLGLSS